MVSIQETIAEAATVRRGLGRAAPVQRRMSREPGGRASPPGAGAERA
jgi:hypothetical protein